jgi:hypothetical protein
MENKRIEDKIDKLHDSLTEVLIILERNTVSLQEHVKRTNLLQERVEHVDKHVTMVNGVLKFIGIMATVVSIYAALKSR